MAKSRLGHSFIAVSGTEDGSVTNVTIPSGATEGYVFWTGWNNASLNLDNALSDAITVDGQNVSFVRGPTAATASLNAYAGGKVTGFSTGINKTVAWKQNGAPSEGAHIVIIWSSGSQIKGTSHFATAAGSQQTLSSGALASVNGDEAIVMAAGFQSGAPSVDVAPSGSGQTLGAAGTQVQSEDIAWGFEGATTTTVTITVDAHFGSMFAVVIEDAPAAGPSGTGNQTFPALGQAGSGGQEIAGAGASAFAALGQAGQGSESIAGSAAQAFAGLDQAAAGTETIAGAADQAFAALAQQGTGQVGDTVGGTAAQSFAPLAQDATGSEALAGTADQLLPALRQSGAGQIAVAGTGASLFAALAQLGQEILAPVVDVASAVPLTGVRGDAAALTGRRGNEPALTGRRGNETALIGRQQG